MASRLQRRLGERGAPCCTSCPTSCCPTSYRYGPLPLHCHLLRAAGDRGVQWRVSTLGDGMCEFCKRLCIDLRPWHLG